MLEATHISTELPSSTLSNTTTKEELLTRAKIAIDAGEASLHDAAEALVLAVDDHKATQREIAEAIGRSASWVNRLLKWRRSGYKDCSPFGPTTKAGRVSHAQQRPKRSNANKASTKHAADGGAPDANREATKPQKANSGPTHTTVDSSLAGFKSAVDYWFAKMNVEAKREAVAYAVSKVEEKVS